MRRFARILCSLVLTLSLVTPAWAQLTAQPIVTGVPALVAFVQDPLAPGTFYLVQQTGTIRVFQNGVLLPTPFIDLTSAISSIGERGLLGMAFSPDGMRLFVNFTNQQGDTVVARFARDGSRRFDLQWPDGQRFISQPASNHNGGHLAFGPDGFLYLGLGDGGGGNDQFRQAQNPNTLLGKMLRIDVNVLDADPKGYRVPASNPFIGLPALPEIWAFGLRNPWRYSFDNPALGGSGALIIADVGQGAREETNYQPVGRGGRNYGWPNREGFIATPGIMPPPPVPLPLVNPIFDYPRSIGTSITGGYVYRGSALPPSFRGRYFVADFSSGRIFSVGLGLTPGTGEATALEAIEHTAELGGDALGNISSFAEDRSGELYLVQIGGIVFKIGANPALLPGAPGSFTSQVSGSTVQLSWQPPAGPAAASYRLEVGAAATASNILVTSLPSNQTTLTVPGVPDGRYFARLRAVNAVGAGPASSEIQVLVGCAAAPTAPAGLTHAATGAMVTLQWGAAAGATSYVLEAGSASGAANVGAASVGSVTGLTVAAPSGTYFVRVRAQNSCGSSVPSNEIAVIVP